MKRRSESKGQRRKSNRLPIAQAKRNEGYCDMCNWPAERVRYLPAIGAVLVVASIVIIYGQTIGVRAIDYEDAFYLVHSPYVAVKVPVAGLGAVWTEPYFANFHPFTTTTWLLDRAVSDKSKPFDAVPFRIGNLVYAAVGGCLLLFLYRRLGVPVILSIQGAVLWTVHPIHTEAIAWLSARKDLISLILILASLLGWMWARAASTVSQWRVRHLLTVILALLAVLAKPIAVIVPLLVVAYEFCSSPHGPITQWRWHDRKRLAVLTRTIVLSACLVIVGSGSSFFFGHLLSLDPQHGGWLILVLLAFSLAMLAAAPSEASLAAFTTGETSGIRALMLPFIVVSLVSGAGAAWTFWAQRQVGAIKEGLTLLPTLNLTSEAMLAYAGKALVPARMSVSYTWSEYPYVSLKGVTGAMLVAALVWIGIKLSGSNDSNRRLVSFGIFWYLIALIPVSNVVPTSTKMADRYLFVPTAGSVLVLAALGTLWASSLRRKKIELCCGFVLLSIVYMAWSYKRTEIWCGRPIFIEGKPQPDLSLWASAVETNPDDTTALRSRALAYLRLNPPQSDKALEDLQHALEIAQAGQSKIAGGRQLVLAPLYEALGDAHFTRAFRLQGDTPGSRGWEDKKEAYAKAVLYFDLASREPSGFASSDARVVSRLAEASEGQAQMDAQELTAAPQEKRVQLIRERDELRNVSQQSMRHARDLLIAGNVASTDPNYRTVILGQGNIIFGREVGAPDEEKVEYYSQALIRYKEAAYLLPDDPRPLLYEGLCYERLTGLARSPQEKRQQFTLGEAALRKALTLNIDTTDYSPSLAYRALASLYSHLNDFQSALDSLKKAQQSDPAGADSSQLEREIHSVEEYLALQKNRR